MSGTTHDIEFVTGYYDLLVNKTLCNLMLEKLEEVDGIKFTEDERTFAAELQATVPEGSAKGDFEWIKTSSNANISGDDIDNPLWEQVLPHAEKSPVIGGSTEVGDVSWITPTGQITTCCWPLGTPGHSW